MPVSERPFDIESHNGCITITSLDSGEHRTVRIRTKSERSKFAPGSRVAELLTGPDNESDYQAFAFVGDGGGSICLRSIERVRSMAGSSGSWNRRSGLVQRLRSISRVGVAGAIGC
jgi:hypothetical protein